MIEAQQNRLQWAIPLAVGLAAMILAVSSIDPSGTYPNAPQGPGLTIDETFNVFEGARLVEGLEGWSLGLFELRQVFGQQDDLGDLKPAGGYYRPDYPPLGRIWLGLCQKTTKSLFPPSDPTPPLLVTACARSASAIMFGLTVFLVGWFASKWYGNSVGFLSAVAVILMPRLFGHARIASLETTMGLAYLATVLCVAHSWSRQNIPSWKTAAWTGCIFGLALLTKIQGVLLPIPIACWALFHWRSKAVVPLLVWGACGGLVFFVGWPWLWLDPIGHLTEYLGRSVERITLYMWYFGARFADRSVPWHFPFVMFLVTVPLGLHILGFAAFFARQQSDCSKRREHVVLGAIVFPLLLFAVPQVTVYDGARLFLMVFPLWAILVGRGAVFVWDRLKQRFSVRAATIVMTLFITVQGWGLVATWPSHLCYYNLLVGGSYGADRLGMEATYWGDGMTRSFLESVVAQVPEGSTIEVSPVPTRSHLSELIKQSPILRRHKIKLQPFQKWPPKTEYLMCWYRYADLPMVLISVDQKAEQLTVATRNGMKLAALYKITTKKKVDE